MPETASKTDQNHAPAAARPVPSPVNGLLVKVATRALRFADFFLFDDCLTDPERGRRGRLIALFGLLGFWFGLAFSTFYLLIGHRWGAGIIIICSVSFLVAPVLMKAARSLDLGGNLMVGIMTAGFTALNCVEGGLSGHAIAWLAIVPLCAQLMAGKSAARRWLIISFSILSGIAGMALAGLPLPVTYPPQWQVVISATGYLALIGFLFGLGLIFETSRERAFDKMQEALAKLAASNEQLVNLNLEKTEFLGIAAHDLKNPLTTVILGAEMMQATNPAAHHKSMLAGIVHAGTHMRELVIQLLDANAIEEGRYVSKLVRCDLAELVTRCVAQNQTAAQRKHIELHLDTTGELPVLADSNAAMQILENLVSNAVKYSPLHTKVRVRGFLENGLGCVAVTDEGPGISEADQKKLFGKFTRLTAKPTGGESSSGLGLSIVKRLAEAMAGCVDCQSRLGAGATFTVRLPAWRQASEGSVSS